MISMKIQQMFELISRQLFNRLWLAHSFHNMSAGDISSSRTVCTVNRFMNENARGINGLLLLLGVSPFCMLMLLLADAVTAAGDVFRRSTEASFDVYVVTGAVAVSKPLRSMHNVVGEDDEDDTGGDHPSFEAAVAFAAELWAGSSVTGAVSALDGARKLCAEAEITTTVFRRQVTGGDDLVDSREDGGDVVSTGGREVSTEG